MKLPVARWSAPFNHECLAGFVPPDELHPGHGDILLIRAGGDVPLPNGAMDESPLETLVGELRRRHPASPVGVWIPNAPADQVIEIVRVAVGASVRAILGGPRADGDRLRQQLTHPQGLSTFILRWAADAGYLPPGTAQQEVRALLDAAPNVRTLQRLASERQEAARTWRSRLQQMGLPTPRAWLGLAHALHVAFYLQRNHEQPLHRLGERLGYSDVTLMAHRFQHVFRMPPGEVRGLLGAEPLLHRWFEAVTR